tara:strand:- start:57 stop:1766 length:1710 start_codon:yes stop_codon:yes gene_type:complete
MSDNSNISKISNSDYEELITKSLNSKNNKEKSIVDGQIIAIENDTVIVDVGLKSEGRIPLSEFTRFGKNSEIKIGDSLKVFIDRIDGLNGETKLSREKAVKQASWNKLQKCFENNEFVTGTPYNKVKGGMSVDLDGVTAFLPGSQIDSKQIKSDQKELLNTPLELMILKMDKYRGNIVVSRRAISEIELKEQRQKLLSNISEGSILEGKIKNITDYGAFVDLGGIDGLVHVTDISWKKINKPSDVLELGSDVKVKVLKYDEEITRLSLGIKQLSDDPWEKIDEHFEIGQNYDCEVSSINDQGVSVSLKNDFEGFISLSEISWLKKPPHPSKILQLSEKLEVKLLDIDKEKRRINCSLKQLKANPWTKVKENFNVGDKIETEIVNKVDFGVFVKVYDEIDGMVHVSDLSWDESKCAEILSSYKKGDKISVKILEIDVTKERISLGIKHLDNDPMEEYILNNPIKSIVTGKISAIDEKGIHVSLEQNINGFVKKSNLAKDKTEQKIDRFAIDEKIDSMIVSFDSKSRKINLSIKDIEIDEEKKVLSKYGSSDSGASLGDILGDALNKKNSD